MPMPRCYEWELKWRTELRLGSNRNLADFLREFQAETLEAAAEMIHAKHVAPKDGYCANYNTGLSDAEGDVRSAAAAIRKEPSR